MGILLKLKNANSDISVIIGDFKNLLSIFIGKSARLISFTSLTSLLATHVLMIKVKLGEQLNCSPSFTFKTIDTTTVELDSRRTKLADHRRKFSVDSCMMCTFLE